MAFLTTPGKPMWRWQLRWLGERGHHERSRLHGRYMYGSSARRAKTPDSPAAGGRPAGCSAFFYGFNNINDCLYSLIGAEPIWRINVKLPYLHP